MKFLILQLRILLIPQMDSSGLMITFLLSSKALNIVIFSLQTPLISPLPFYSTFSEMQMRELDLRCPILPLSKQCRQAQVKGRQ
jgi:hypothetical protein